MQCPKCNEENPPGSSFCSNCGTSLIDQPISDKAEEIHDAETVIRSPVPFYLTLLTGPEKDRTIPLEQYETRLGRETDNDVVLIDPQVSRHHARIIRTGANYEIEDLGSANGVHLNDVPISSPQRLKENDKFRLGDTEVRFSKVSIAVDSSEIDDATISMRDDTPVKPQTIPPVAAASRPTIPPPMVSPARTESEAIESPTSPRPQPVPGPAQPKKTGAGRLLLLSCALIILLLLILVFLVVIVMPQYGQSFL